MDKQHIIDEIIRTSEKNGGRPLGRQRFFSETGIKESEWYGKYWARWSDALKEAGYTPNAKQDSYEEEWLIEQLISFIKEIGSFPTFAELRLKARRAKGFPSHSTFARLGNKIEVARKILDYCHQKSGYDDVIIICQSITAIESKEDDKSEGTDDSTLAFVYLLKSGRHYKIGRSNFVGRREYELSIQLPERVSIVHSISTDDPIGIEAYWHKRFKDRRKNGEWFELTSHDVKAFKKRKFM
jgi:Meiotically up-regulated gene 113